MIASLRRRWQTFEPRWTLIALCAIVTGLVAVAPHVEHIFSPEYRGLTVIRDKDYANYDSRLQRALVGHPEEAANGITPIGSGVEGMQPAGMEAVLGMLLGWTGLAAPTLSVLLMGFLTPVVFLLLYALFRVLEFRRRTALAMNVFLFVVNFGSLSRVMHPAWSFIPVLGALILFLLFWKRPTVWLAVLAGLLLGILPYLYFWGWTWVWAIVVCIVLFDTIARGKRCLIARHLHLLILAGVITILLAVPFVVHLLWLFAQPLYHEVSIRGDFLYQYSVESPTRTILLFLQFFFLLLLFRAHHRDWRYIAMLSMLGGIVLAMHQNFLTGRVLMFASHYYSNLVISTLVVGVWALENRVWIVARVPIILISLLFLAACFYDENRSFTFLIPQPFDFRDQHLAGAIRLLQQDHQKTVLTDAVTGRVVTAWTDDGIVYTTHVRFLLVSDAEMAERYCVSQMFSVPFPDAYRTIYMEYNRNLDSPAMRTRENLLVDDACKKVRADPAAYLDKYHVDYVLWNQQQYEAQKWSIDPQKFHLVEVGRGDGWILWKRLAAR